MEEIRDIIEDLDSEFLENLEEDLSVEISNVERYLMNSSLFFDDLGVWGHSVWKRHLGCNLLIFGSQTLRTTELGKN